MSYVREGQASTAPRAVQYLHHVVAACRWRRTSKGGRGLFQVPVSFSRLVTMETEDEGRGRDKRTENFVGSMLGVWRYGPGRQRTKESSLGFSSLTWWRIKRRKEERVQNPHPNIPHTHTNVSVCPYYKKRNHNNKPRWVKIILTTVFWENKYFLSK